MRYASSLLYGGMLVDAQGASYQDYSRLLLQCPFCKEPVFLSAAKHRIEHARLAPKSKQIVLVKECVVSASFAHFKSVAANKCEIKAKYINQGDIKRGIVRGRNQRLKFFQSRFGQIIFSGFENDLNSAFDFYKRANCSLPEYMINEIAQYFINEVVKKFKAIDNDSVKNFGGKLLSEAAAHPNDFVITESEAELNKATAWLNCLEIELHLQIVCEAVEFLKTKSALCILDKFVNAGLCYLTRILDKNKIIELMQLDKDLNIVAHDYSNLVSGITNCMVAILVGTQWAKAMQNINGK